MNKVLAIFLGLFLFFIIAFVTAVLFIDRFVQPIPYVTTLTVNVYDGNHSTSDYTFDYQSGYITFCQNLTRVAGAKVELYKVFLHLYPSCAKCPPTIINTTFVSTGYTDENGTAKFSGMEISADSYYVVNVSKEGYYLQVNQRFKYPGSLDVFLNPVSPLRVTVTAYDGGAITWVPQARVDVYDNSNSENVTLVKTLYTDSTGLADFGVINLTAIEVVVTKQGYSSIQGYPNDSTIFTYDSGGKRDIEFELTNMVPQSGIYSGEPFHVIVRGWDASGNLNKIEGANVRIYTWSGVLVASNLTDSSGSATLSGVGVSAGNFTVDAPGYDEYNSFFYSSNIRNMSVILAGPVNNASAMQENCTGTRYRP